jgi:hypothetical protein
VNAFSWYIVVVVVVVVVVADAVVNITMVKEKVYNHRGSRNVYTQFFIEYILMSK